MAERNWKDAKQDFDVIENEEPSVIKRGLPPMLSFIMKELRTEISLLPQEIQDNFSQKNFCTLLDSVAERQGLELAPFERDEILELLEKEQKPFGLLQTLIDDDSVSDIIVANYDDIVIQQKRKNYKTDLSFPNRETYVNFVEKLLQKANTSYSTAHPITDGMIEGKVRIHAVHSSICAGGPYITLRVNRFSKVTIKDLIKYELAPKEVFDYLDAIVKSGLTLFIAGEVGTGKTTLIRALSACIFEEESILVIEDTPEISLDHPHARYLRVREANADNAGLITPSQCIRAGMRMAMNRIIFGEIRDAGAGEAFIDVCASGHSGMSTIHAKSAQDAIARLELFLGRAQKGVSNNILKEQIASAVAVVVHLDICHHTGFRRIMEVREIGQMADNVIRQREIFKYIPGKEPTWKVQSKTSNFEDDFLKRGISFDLRRLPDELVIRK